MTNEERIIKMHERARELARKKQKREIDLLGGLSAGLLVALVALIRMEQNALYGIAGNQPTGSSLLSDSAGGYVLVAVLAFALGVTLTTVIRWYKARTHNDQN